MTANDWRAQARDARKAILTATTAIDQGDGTYGLEAAPTSIAMRS